MKRLTRVTTIVSLMFAAGAANANGYSKVAINGQRLTVSQVEALERQLGARIAPGSYLYNANNGCWANLTTGQSGCLGGAASTFSRYGSGERNANGDWSYWSNIGGGAVGGSGNGCVYAFQWSNC